ncbi:MAG: prolyl oligopeptidase family serine peptidase [Ilumatobacter sp.]
MNTRRALIAAGAATAFVATSLVAGVASPTSAEDPWFYDPERLEFDALEGATASWGDIDGAAYRVEMPDDWNGDLVMWAHGYRGEGLELSVDNPPIREHLIEQGYAWAASSYGRNGYAVRQGVDDTKALADYVIAEMLPEDPDLVYVSGFSMGGHITGVAIEEHHALYDGAMPMCGVMGDYELFDFFVGCAVVGERLALRESQFPFYPSTASPEPVPALKAAFGAFDGAWPFFLNEKGQQFKNLVEEQSGGERPNFDEAWPFWADFLFNQGGGNGVLPNSDGRSVVENASSTYQLDFNSNQTAAERELNRNVVRVDFEKGSRGNESITGLLRDRVLSLHNLGDLFVTYEMEIDYARDVAKQGRSNRLVQRAIRGVGHCDFTQYEMITAFDDLVNWVETGERPAGDEVLRDRAVAADDYGCQFTDPAPGAHLFATPCD